MAKHLLRLDWSAAFVAGLLVILFSTPLSSLEGIPTGIILFTGVVNLLYGSFSLWIWLQPDRTVGLVKLLAACNMAWTPICFGLAIAFASTATVFGFVHLVGEGIFVGLLGILEWRNRELLSGAA